MMAKNTPKVDGADTYNAWGYGIFPGSSRGFDNWARGVETVSKYLGDNFFAKGVSDTCVIMKTYTPPSTGSWCSGVNYFGNLIQNFSSPDLSTL